MTTLYCRCRVALGRDVVAAAATGLDSAQRVVTQLTLWRRRGGNILATTICPSTSLPSTCWLVGRQLHWVEHGARVDGPGRVLCRGEGLAGWAHQR